MDNLRTVYLSFARPKSEGGFIGGAFVAASDFKNALDRVNKLGINPGGHVAAIFSPPVKPEMMDRLLSKAELDAAYGQSYRVPPSPVIGGACEQENKPSKPEDAN